jgi:hypothetical protein
MLNVDKHIVYDPCVHSHLLNKYIRLAAVQTLLLEIYNIGANCFSLPRQDLPAAAPVIGSWVALIGKVLVHHGAVTR